MTTGLTEPGRIVFDGALTIRTVEAACAVLLEGMAQHQAISIDCSAATEVDLSFIQLLIAARVSARSQHKQVFLQPDPDGPLLDALTGGGFHVSFRDQTGDATGCWFDGAAA